ncbi:MAG: tRNA (guanine(46)-N(7))-methyltransferase TrmB, partial [Candidatus Binatia bacterium]
NARVVAADAALVLSRFVPDESVRAVHVYFPDPWWKRRHQKRRIVTPELARALHRILERGGTLYLATDVEERFHAILEALSGAPFEVRIGESAPGRPLTNFERKYRAAGRPIHSAALVKR